ncbi:unnamed protein product [Bursaphelenchus okinawaensis]|uniref:Chloride channel protein n=1 Tax=Bursaphelenchus okinawaensis TaxID=465554 RepID=A0A811L1F3_9BILA|nr:unnamed protein product [Bursaphelenchus okinawaensis]CAG9115181.1 unnamed protein product [Bursaphelenchus okinawaensis]
MPNINRNLNKEHDVIRSGSSNRYLMYKVNGSIDNGTKVADAEFYKSYAGSFYSSDKKERWKQRFRNVLNWIFNDWVIVIMLGCGMAFCSILLDRTVALFSNGHTALMLAISEYDDLIAQIFSIFCWVLYIVALVTCSASVAHYMAPQAIGSGIPEMKTILRGVVLQEYLAFRTMISKIIGLTLALASGIPIGKEGPFVHIASIMANILGQLVQSIDPIYTNESRHTELLAAGCAVGVACVFSAPVGGVLFSIEVTSAYFAIRNYWRGFLAAACAASVFRLMKVLFHPEENLVAIYQTYFPQEAFVSEELVIFAILGWLTYPIVASFLIAVVTYPKWSGAYLGGFIRFSESPQYLFLNCTWNANYNSSDFCPNLRDWLGKHYERDVFEVMWIFLAGCYFLTILSLTLPIPCGVFGPSFTIGAAIGRLLGEYTAVAYPRGFGSLGTHIYPGGYAVVGAAAFSGGVTHTLSVAVIAFELTGQLVFILPVMIASLISNAICSNLQPSFYDSVILIKNLPYLPDIPSSSKYHSILARQFMTNIENVWYLCQDTTYKTIQNILFDEAEVKVFPVIESEGNKVLIGSCSRVKLLKALEATVGATARKAKAARQIAENINTINRRFKPVHAQRNSIVLDNEDILHTKHVEFKLSNDDSINFYYEDCPKTLTQPPSRFSITPVDVPPLTKVIKPEVGGQKNHGIKKSVEHLLPLGVGDLFRTITQVSFSKQRKTFDLNGYDLHGKERREWEHKQLAQKVDWTKIGIDPAPFQLVDDTSLIKVHFLFSLLGLTRSYVTHEGKLVGIIALRDIRAAVEKVQNGRLTSTTSNIYVNDDITKNGKPTIFSRIRNSVSGALWLNETKVDNKLNPLDLENKFFDLSTISNREEIPFPLPSPVPGPAPEDNMRMSAVAVAPLAIGKDLGSTPRTAPPRRLEEWVVLSARGLGTSILGLHEYMIKRQKSYGAPHPQHSDARDSEIPGERPNYGKLQTQG